MLAWTISSTLRSTLNGTATFSQRIAITVESQAGFNGDRDALGEGRGPFLLARNHVQAVSAPGQRLAFDSNGIAEVDGAVLVGAGPPDLSVGLEATPDLP